MVEGAEGVRLDSKLTLISSFYSVGPLMACFKELSPSRVILFTQPGGDDRKAEETLKENYSLLEKTIGRVVKLEKRETSPYDMYQVAKDITTAIERENASGNDVILNFTGGRRTMALGGLFAGYARKDMIKRIVYFTEEDNTLIDLPKLSFELNETQHKILEELEKGKNKPIPDIAKKVGVTKGMTYIYLKELKNHGYLNDKNEITTAGKLALL